MPRLTHLIHPHYGRLPVNADGPCPSCGMHNAPCYLICPCSPASQTYEEERADALATEAEIAAVGFQAWDSAQHRAHGLPCPYDGHPVNEYPEWEDGDTLTYEAHMDDAPEPSPAVRKCEFLRADSRPCEREATVYGGYAGAGGWAGRACDDHAQAAGFTVWDRLVPTVYVPDTGPWPDDDDLPF